MNSLGDQLTFYHMLRTCGDANMHSNYIIQQAQSNISCRNQTKVHEQITLGDAQQNGIQNLIIVRRSK